MLKIKVFCEAPVTEIHARNIFGLVCKSVAKKGLPHGSHLLVLRGKYANQAIKEFAKVNVNWTRGRIPAKYGVQIGNAVSFSRNMEILTCPNTLI